MHAQPYFCLSAHRAVLTMLPVSELCVTHHLLHTASARQSGEVRSCHRAQCTARNGISSEFWTGFTEMAVALSVIQQTVCSNTMPHKISEKMLVATKS